MTFLVRKFNRAKWSTTNNVDVFDINSDAITTCLKSSGNTLSVWEINKVDDLDSAVLAMASNFDKLEAADFVILEKKSLESKDIDIVKTDGNTVVEDLIETHYDLSKLNYFKIGLIAEHLSERIVTHHKRYTLAELRKVLFDAIKSGRLKDSDIKEKVLLEVKKHKP